MSEGKFWQIEGFDSLTKTFETSLPLGLLSENEMIGLLQRLASRHLDEDEVVAASLRANASGYAPLLEAQVDRKTPQTMIMVGTNPYYIAAVRE